MLRTVYLSVNWLLYGFFLLVLLGLFRVVVLFDFVNLPISVLVYSAIGASLVSLALALAKKRFVQVDKAGICYSSGLRTHYISREDIVRIYRKKLLLLTFFVVETNDNTAKSFYSWSLSEADFDRANQLLSNK
ncbi:hypothetical protein [Pseudoalteromonas sp. T1lg23B]|uniref:hypothetical protein n=1 Tax=Pseudoalteromonas sp. T1lg23B TaxID=2077097 RepID=UPI000CF6489B|nr:hypothetical protein [Pseudoalteromonas sp. T1lg23B]